MFGVKPLKGMAVVDASGGAKVGTADVLGTEQLVSVGSDVVVVKDDPATAGG